MLAVPTDRPLGRPVHCRRCGEPHTVKHYHVTLDSEGNSIVSDTVWDRLREIGTHQFVVLNEVKNPPALRVGFDNRIRRSDLRMVKQVGKSLQDMSPRGTQVTVQTER